MVRTTWLRRISLFVTTATMAGFGFTGIASAQTITNTGNSSTNTIKTTADNSCTVYNTNNVSGTNLNVQSASSGNATEDGNTGSGLSWDGWSSLDPATAQTNSISYNSWNSQTTDWIGQRAGGSGWSSTETNLSWTPSSTSWSSWDPVTWQTNGQSFDNWYNAVESYLDTNSSAWLLSWPADATGSGAGSVTTGNTVNTNNANFSISINNTARAVAGTNACGQSNFTPPASSGGGMGGGPNVSTSAAVARSFEPQARGGSGGVATGGGSFTPTHVQASTPAAPQSVAIASVGTPPASNPPVAPSVSPASVSNSATISNTGQGSTNTISSTVANTSTATNNNTVAVTNINVQSASSGSASTSDNTTASNSASGNASNGNNADVDTGLNG